eukprot:SAG11_NODE_334_length_10569_cov_9.662082_1_plen_386_part_10
MSSCAPAWPAWLPPAGAAELALAQAVEEEGYCVMDNWLSPAELERLRAGFERLIAPAQQAFEDAGAQNHKGQRILGLPDDFLCLDDAFMRLAEHPKLLPVVAELVGPDLQLQEVFSRRYPPEPPSADAVGYLDWHHDAPTPGCWRWIKVQVLLSDVSHDGGCFCVVPRSHKLSDGAVAGGGKEVTQARWREYKGTRQEEMPHMLRFDRRAGTAVVFDTHTWHTALANTAAVARDSIFLEYTPFWHRQTTPVAGWARRLDAAGRAGSPLRRQLLGLIGPHQYSFVGPAYSRGVYGAHPRTDPSSERMAPWVRKVIARSAQDATATAADRERAVRDAAAFERDGFVVMRGALRGAALAAAQAAFASSAAATAAGTAPGGPEEVEYLRH